MITGPDPPASSDSAGGTAEPARSLRLERAHQLAHTGDMPAADGQGLAVEALEVQLKMPERRALQALDAVAGDQGVAVDAHEALAEFALQGLERLIEEHLAAFVAQGHVLVVGDEVDHLVQRHQLDAFAGPRADV